MIKIIDGYAFKHDRFGYTLIETGKREKCEFGTNKKTGELVEYSDTLGYYLTVSSMLNALLQFATKKAAEASDVKQIGDYIAIMEQISQQIQIATESTAF